MAPNQLKLSTRRPSSGRCRPQTTSASNDVPRLAAPLLRPTTCPTPSRGRKEEARATTSGTRGRRACGGTTSRTNRTSAERRVSRAPAAATPTPSAADGGRESTRRGATRPSPSRLPPAAPRGVGCTALRDGPGGGERPLPPAWRTTSPVEASLSSPFGTSLSPPPISPRRIASPPSLPRRPPELSLLRSSHAQDRWTIGPRARRPGRHGYRLRTLSPLGPPSRPPAGRAPLGRLRRPARPARSIVPPPQRQWRAWGGRRHPRSPSWGCPPLSSHRSPPPVAPHTLVPPQGRKAARHVQRLPRPTSPSRPPPRPRRWPRRPRRSPCGSFGSRAPSLSRPRCSHGPSPRPSGRRRRLGVTSAPPEHLPGGQRLRSGAGGPCEPAGATSEYSKARASPLSPARRVSLTTPPPPGSGVHRAYKMAAGRTSSDAVSLARAVGNSLAGLGPSRAAASCAMRVPSAARPCPCPSPSDAAAGPVWRPGTTA